MQYHKSRSTVDCPQSTISRQLEESMKLNKNAFALALGIVWGVIVFLVTNIDLLRGGSGEHLSRLSQIYLGYRVSFLGSIIGLLWGFVTMSIAAWVAAWLYNRLSESLTTAPKT